MDGLIITILNGKYKKIPSIYSKDLSSLIEKMLEKDPEKRLSIRQILDLPILTDRIQEILSDVTVRGMFSETFKMRNLKYFSAEEGKEEVSEEIPKERAKATISRKQLKNYIRSKRAKNMKYLNPDKSEPVEVQEGEPAPKADQPETPEISSVNAEQDSDEGISPL